MYTGVRKTISVAIKAIGTATDVTGGCTEGRIVEKMDGILDLFLFTLPGLSGRYCDSIGLDDPHKVPGSGECDAGFYCESGATTPRPTGAGGTAETPELAGLCPVGHYCLKGGAGPQYPTPCPIGTFLGKCALDYCTVSRRNIFG